MFQQMKNIDTAFRQIRTFCIIAMVASALLSTIALFKSYQFADRTQQRIYVLANGKALEAVSASRKDNIAVEARDHISTFHRYFFTLDPDDKMIRFNTNKALNLADHSAKRQYDNLRENGYYSGLISGNVSQEVTDDSIVVDINDYPYRFTYYGKQKVIRATSVVTRTLVTNGLMRNVARSDNNPHGFLIEKWTTLDNHDINIQNR
ncbi:MAG: conjugative transposon protein TraK [Sphingobacteriales bacterium]|nr:MAG: conjugative transposon protein TraK [Sphingobacteriales bacterium]